MCKHKRKKVDSILRKANFFLRNDERPTHAGNKKGYSQKDLPSKNNLMKSI